MSIPLEQVSQAFKELHTKGFEGYTDFFIYIQNALIEIEKYLEYKFEDTFILSEIALQRAFMNESRGVHFLSFERSILKISVTIPGECVDTYTMPDFLYGIRILINAILLETKTDMYALFEVVKQRYININLYGKVLYG